MTKLFKYRILKEHSKGQYCAVSLDGAIRQVFQNPELPDEGIIQVKDTTTGVTKTVVIKGERNKG